MRIENFQTRKNGDLARVSATLIWEDRDRPSQEIYIETTADFEDSINCNPNSFLIAGAMPAMRYGEKRIAIEGEVCPELKESLPTAMACLCNWYGGDRRIIPIEAKVQSHPPMPATPPRAGVFFSGGVDALTTLINNRCHFPLEHPSSHKDGFLIYGFVGGLEKPDPDFNIVTQSVSKLAEAANINLIPISTNIYTHIKDLDEHFFFFEFEFLGGFLASIGHVFSSRFDRVSIASGAPLPYLNKYGSHPFLDENYSSRDLKFKHENLTLSRLEKTKLVMEWEVVRENLWVCDEVPDSYKVGLLNCGKCGKCVRTMTGLIALGILDRVSAFAQKDVSEELLLKTIKIRNPYQEYCYRELIEPLTARGRYDLVRAINKLIARYHERDLKGTIKRFDRTFFNGNLNKLGKRVVSN
jgi:hypothetical protein